MTKRHALSTAHRLLTISALNKGRTGQECFGKWAKLVELTNIDYASQKVLPAIIHHLNDDDLSRQIMQLVKFTRLRAQTLIESGFYVQEVLQRGSIPFAWTSGGAVMANTNIQISSRTFDDIGFLVPSSQVESAKRILQESGLQALANHELADISSVRKGVNNALRLRYPNGAILSLYWDASSTVSCSGSEEALWRRISKVKLVGRETFSISTEDTLLQVFASIGGGNEACWVIDAISILEANDVDFGLLSQISKESGFWTRTQISLIRLAEFRPDLTPKVYRALTPTLAALDRIGFSWIGRVLYIFARSMRTIGKQKSV